MNGKEWLDLVLLVGAWLGLLYTLWGLALVLRLSRRMKALLQKMQGGRGHD